MVVFCQMVAGAEIASPPAAVQVHSTRPAARQFLARWRDIKWVNTGVFSKIFYKKRRLSQTATLSIDRHRPKQQILGFGGAFTEASALNWMSLPDSDRQDVMRLYFGSPEEGGNGYSMGRVHINSCDFSVTPYTYDETAGDVELKHFDTGLTHDQAAMLPFIKRAVSRAEAAGVKQFRIIASPWSPPAWMKRPGIDGIPSMMGSDQPMGLRPEYNRTWAKYISKFVRAYQGQGIPVWAVTAQNEPGSQQQEWESCAWTAHDESVWIRNHLGPILRKDHPELQILGFDHNKDKLAEWARELYQGDGGASLKYVDGLAMHWYTGSHFDKVKEAAAIGGSDKFLIGTEACNCPGIANDMNERVGRAERLLHDMIGDINAGAHSWLDWNLLLDPSGGPSHAWAHARGYTQRAASCDAHIIADTGHTLSQQNVWLQPSYYYIGHISRFARQGARVLHLDRSSLPIEVDAVAFLSPSPSGELVVLVMMNRGDDDAEFVLSDTASRSETSVISVPPHSVITYTYSPAAGSTWTHVVLGLFDNVVTEVSGAPFLMLFVTAVILGFAGAAGFMVRRHRVRTRILVAPDGGADSASPCNTAPNSPRQATNSKSTLLLCQGGTETYDESDHPI